MRKSLIVFITYVLAVCYEAVIFTTLSIFINPEMLNILTMAIVALAMFATISLIGSIYDHDIGLSILHWFSLIFTPVSSIVIILIVFIYKFNTYPTIIVLTLLIIMNILNVVLLNKIVYFYKISFDKVLVDSQNQAYLNQFDLIYEKDNQLKSVTHDLKNHLTYLAEYLKKNETSKALEYIYTINDSINLKNEFISTGNFQFDAFINYKLSYLKNEFNAQISTEIVIPDNLFITSFENCVIFGNLLDNVADAFEKLPTNWNKELRISILYNKNILFISCSNTYNNSYKKFDIHNIKTTKSDSKNHGIGLKNINSIVDKYGGNIKLKPTNDRFTVDIFLFDA